MIDNARQAGLKDAQDWLLDVMGDWDFTIPNGAFDKIAACIAAQSADASNAAPSELIDILKNQQNNLAASRRQCSDFEGMSWDALQRVIDYLSTSNAATGQRLTEIQRFDLDMDGSMDAFDGGRWVRYEDVSALLAAPAAPAPTEEKCDVCGGVGMHRMGCYSIRDLTAPAPAAPAPTSTRDEIEARQRAAMNARFANRPSSPATADFDLPAPNDPRLQELARIEEHLEQTKARREERMQRLGIAPAPAAQADKE